MKIKYFHPPTVPVIHLFGDKIEALQRSLVNGSFIDSLKEWNSWEYNELIELHYFVDVLNAIDKILQDFIITWNDVALLSDDYITLSNDYDKLKFERDCDQVRVVLKFSSILVSNTVEKAVYNSCEHLSQLIKCFDHEIACLALEVMSCLVIPPNYHRCHLDWNAHSTVMHKSPSFWDSLFVIIDSAKNVSDDSYPSVENLLSNNPISKVISIDIGGYAADGTSQSSEQNFKVDSTVREIIDMSTEVRSLREICNDSSLAIPKELRLLFLWRLRMTTFQLNETTRWCYYKAYYEAIATLLCCHQDVYVLATYFHDKQDFVKDFIYLIRSGPGSDDYSGKIPLKLRLLASSCLQALFGSEDGADSGVFGRFAQLQHSLGLGRGQYMGVLPCLLRSSAAYLVSIAQSDMLLSSYTSPNESVLIPKRLVREDINEPDTLDHAQQLVWIESIFLFTLSVLQFAETGQYLPENGLLSALIAILKIPPFKNRSRMWAFVDSVAIMVCDTCLGIGQVCSSFIRQDGLETVMTKIQAELEFLYLDTEPVKPASQEIVEPRSRRSFSFDASWENYAIDVSKFSETEIEQRVGSSRIIMQHLMSLLTMILEKGLQDSYEHRVITTFKSTAFASSLTKLYSNMPILTTRLCAMVDALVSDMINLDPSTPSMLVHLCQSGVVKVLLQNYVKSEPLPFRKYQSDAVEAFVIDRSNLFFSLALTSQGIDLLKEINPFSRLLSIFHEEKYNFPGNPILRSEVIKSVGGSLEEIVRHYPSLSDVVLESFLEVMRILIERSYSRKYTTMNSENIALLHSIASIIQCLNCLLTREACVSNFIAKNGIVILTDILPIALGPNRFFLANMACAVNSTTHFVGNLDTVLALTQCLHSISNIKQSECLDSIISTLDKALDQFAISLTIYWDFIRDGKLPSPTLNSSAGWRNLGINLALLIDTVAHRPLQSPDIYEDNDCSKDLSLSCNLFTNVMKSMVMVSYLLNIMYPISSTSNAMFNSNSSPTLSQLSHDRLYEMAYFISKHIFVSAQTEIARHTQATMYSQWHFAEKYTKKSHPLYRLLVTAENGVWVKEKADDSSKKLYEIPKGTVVDAYERKQVGGKILKYRVDDGWINCFRKMSSVEPALEVIDVLSKSIEQLEQEMYISASVTPDVSDNNYENKSLGDITVSRAGYISMFHLSFSVRLMIESVLKSLSSSCSALFGVMPTSKPARISRPHLRRNISLMHETLLDVTTALSGYSPLVKAPRPNSSQDEFFVVFPSPLSLQQCNISFVYLTLTTIEMCTEFFFSSKSSQDVNILALLHCFYDGNIIETLIQSSVLVFMCGYENLDSEDLSYSNMDLCSLSADQYKSVIKDRQKFSLESAGGIIEFWSRLLNFLAQSTSTIERNLMKSTADPLYDYDAYVFRRQLALLLVKYLLPNIVGRPEKLRLLPVSIVKLILDMAISSTKAIQEVKTLQATYSKTWLTKTKESTSGKPGNATNNSSNSRLFPTLMEAFEMGLSSSGMLQTNSRRPSRPRRTLAGPRPSRTTFRPSEASIQAAVSMGFHRNAVLRAMHELRDDRINVLAVHLTEFQFDETELPESMLRDLNMLPNDSTQSLTSNLNPASDTNVENATTQSDPASVSGNVEAILDRVFPDIVEFREPESSAKHQDTVTSLEDDSVILVPKVPESFRRDNDVEKKSLSAVLDQLFEDIYITCLTLIETGFKNESSLEILSSEGIEENKNYSRDVSTVLILSQLISCLDRRMSSKLHVKLRALYWLYCRGTVGLDKLLGKSIKETDSGSLFGVLHAINVLFYGHSSAVSSNLLGGFTKAQNDQQTLAILMFTKDQRFSVFYDKLFSLFTKFTDEIEFNSSLEQSAWLAPCMLLFDIAAQQLLIDKDGISELIKDASLDDVDLMPCPLNDDFFSKESGQRTRSLSDVHRISLERKPDEQNVVFTSNFLEYLKSELQVPVSNSLLKQASSNASLSDTDSLHGFSVGVRKPLSSIEQSSSLNENKLNEETKKTTSLNKNIAFSNQSPNSLLNMDRRRSLVKSCLTILKNQQTLAAINSTKKIDVNLTRYVAISHAALQLLVHLSQYPDTREVFEHFKAVDVLINVVYVFPGVESIIFTLLQRQHETRDMLSQIMASDLKTLFMKLEKKKKTGTPRVYLANLIDVVAPLAHRDFSIFMDVMKKCFVFNDDHGVIYLEWNNKAFEATEVTPHLGSPETLKRKSQFSNVFEDSTNQNGNETSDNPAVKKLRLSEDGSGVKSLVNQTVSKAPLISGSIHVLTESILNRIMHSWYSVITNTLAYPLGLSISDCLLILSDLIATIPGVATCVHKFNIQDNKFISLMKKPSYLSDFTLETPTGFLSFLIYNLLLSTPTPSGTSKIESDSEMVHAAVGTSIKDSASYLLASLVSRPGEGRKRTLQELFQCLTFRDLENICLPPSSLHGILIVLETLGCLLSPPARWKGRETFVVPSIDIVYLMTKMDAHNVLGKLLYSVSLEQPSALEVISKLSTTMNFFLRKGVDLAAKVHAHQSTFSNTKKSASTLVDSSSKIMSSESSTPSREESANTDSSRFEDISSQEQYHNELFAEGFGNESGLSSQDISTGAAASGWGEEGAESSESEGGESVAGESDSENGSDSGNDSDQEENFEMYNSRGSRSRIHGEVESEEEDDDESDMNEDEDNQEEEDVDQQGAFQEIDDNDHDSDEDNEDDSDHDEDNQDVDNGEVIVLDDHLDNDDEMDDGENEDENEDDDDDDDDENEDEEDEEEDANHFEVLEYGSEEGSNEDNSEGDIENSRDNDDIPEDDNPAEDIGETEDNDRDNDVDADPNLQADFNGEDEINHSIPDGMDVVFEDQWPGIYQSNSSEPHDEDESNEDSQNDAGSHDSAEEANADTGGGSFLTGGRSARSGIVGNMELNVHGIGDPIRFRVNFDNSSDPMDLFSQVINRTIRMRSNGAMASPNRVFNVMGGNTPSSASRRRSNSSRRQSRDWGPGSGDINFRRSRGEPSPGEDDEDVLGRLSNMLGNDSRGLPSGSAIFITDRNGTREVESSGMSGLFGGQVGAEIADIIGGRQGRSSRGVSHSEHWANFDTTASSEGNWRSHLFDSNSHNYLPQELANRPIVNPLLASMDVLRLSRANRTQFRGSGYRLGSQTNTSGSIGLLTSSLQTSLSGQSQAINQNRSIFTYRNTSEPVVEDRSFLINSDNFVTSNVRSYVRIPRSNSSSNRRQAGPQASDRRWGVDVGLIQAVSDTVGSLTQAIQSSIEDSHPHLFKTSTEKKGRTILKKSILQPEKGSHTYVNWDDIFSDTSHLFGNQTRNRSHIDESKDEDELQETKDNEDEINLQSTAVLPQNYPSQANSDVEIPIDINSLDNSQIPNPSSDSSNPDAMDSISSQTFETIFPSIENAEMVISETSAVPETLTVPLTRLNASVRPPEVDPVVWDNLPLDLQIEFLSNQGLDTTQLIESEISSSGVNREVLMNLPPDVMTQVLVEESSERKRRLSIDQPLEPQNVNPIQSSSSTSSVTIATEIMPAIVNNLPPTQTSTSVSDSNENIEFINSLSYDLRSEVLASADSQFLSTLTPSLREEARQARIFLGLPVVNDVFPAPIVPSTTNVPIRNAEVEDFSNSFHRFLENHRRIATAQSGANSLEQLSTGSALIDAASRSQNPTTLNSSRGTLPRTLESDSNIYVLIPTDRAIPENFTGSSRSFYDEITTVSYRLLRCILSLSGRSKSPRPLLKLLSTICMYGDSRTVVLESIFGTLSADPDLIFNGANRILSPALQNDVSIIVKLSSGIESHPLTLKRLLHCISYLCRKTSKVVWIDILKRPSNPNSTWLFGCLLRLLKHSPDSSQILSLTDRLLSGNIDTILHLVEELVAPLSRISVEQANHLVRIHQNDANTNLKNRTDDMPPLKRVRFEDGNVETVNICPEKDEETNKNQASTKPRSTLKCEMPFPALTASEAEILSEFIGSESGMGSHRKRLLKILRVFSLYDGNWNTLLNQLCSVGQSLAGSVSEELTALLEILGSMKIKSGQNSRAFADDQIKWNQQVQQRLLNTLETMTLLRSRSSATAHTESQAVSDVIRLIDFRNCWNALFDCLDHVRDMEGLTYETIEENIPASHGPTPQSATPGRVRHNSRQGSGHTPRHISSTSPRPEGHSHRPVASASSTPNPQNRTEDNRPLSSLSSLTMRFIPLIECFLLVCGATVIKKGGASSSQVANSNSTSSIDTSLPGHRFRQNSSYLDMQIELNQEEYFSSKLISFVEKNRLLLNIVLKSNIQLLETSFSPLIYVPRCRHLLHFDIKRSYFRMKLKKLKQQAQRSMSAISNGHLHIKVRRSEVFVDSFRNLRYKSAEEMKKKLAVEFTNEEGMDAGGLTREWFSVLAKEIFNANYALFNATNDNVTFQPNPQSFINPEHLSYFKFVGRVIGKAILDNHLFDAHFTRSFYKHILGLPVSVSDLESIEPDYYKSLKQILDTPLDLLGLDLTFTAETHNFGQVEVVDLIERGRDILVTDDNKFEYVRLIANFRMVTAIRKQIDAFLEGFHELIPPELISIFDAQELELLISGLPDIDLDDLRAHTDYEGGYKPTDPNILNFWTVLKSFSKEEKALFLQFVTGTSKVPLDGFRALRGSDGIRIFNIHKAYGGKHLLPSAHTCFNQLDLPEYDTEEELKEKLLIAIKEGSEGFGFA